MYDQTRAQQPPDRRPGSAGRRTAGPEPLLGPDERDALAQRLNHALNTFPHTPREALAEAETAFDEAAAHLMAALTERRAALHAHWRDRDPRTQGDELRQALREYREITQRLLRM
ncbi:hypothetical protein ACGFS9_10565 [Streptomyces sp. NPDC048566]|uniref:hypothetical protein n=1 Tax=Streptomyces sp. NPDC048566 TaxID=3365569 RepID=UPI0037117452